VVTEKDLALVRRILVLLIAVYSFLVSIKLMGIAFKLFGRGFAEALISTTSNPFVGLFVGILATSIVQSSSCTTSILVGLVAGGGITIANAIPIVMGANIGTTVTNTVVSLGHITRKQEFRKAFAGAVVHDFFNILAVLILLPLELTTHFLQRLSASLIGLFVGVGGLKFISPLAIIVKPPAEAIKSLLHSSPLFIFLIALVILFTSLRFLVKVIRSLTVSTVEKFFDKYLFSNAFKSLFVGLLITAAIQSSSVTTSLVIPLVGAGVLSVEKIFPYVLGANVGTTVTAILASLVTHNPAAITTAIIHLLFNLSGICIIYPLKKVPITLAEWFGKICSDSRAFSLIYVIIVFYCIPLILIFLTR